MKTPRNIIKNKNTSTQCNSNPPIQNLLILLQLNKEKVSQCSINKRHAQLNNRTQHYEDEFYHNNNILNQLKKSELLESKCK